MQSHLPAVSTSLACLSTRGEKVLDVASTQKYNKSFNNWSMNKTTTTNTDAYAIQNTTPRHGGNLPDAPIPLRHRGATPLRNRTRGVSVRIRVRWRDAKFYKPREGIGYCCCTQMRGQVHQNYTVLSTDWPRRRPGTNVCRMSPGDSVLRGYRRTSKPS